MQFNFVRLSNFTGILEPYGNSYILKLSCIEGKSDAAELLRAVTALYNFGAIDFIPEIGEREYKSLAPYKPGVDTVALLQTSKNRLRRALETMGAVEAYIEWMPLLTKRDTSKPRNKINPQSTDLFPEIKKLVDNHESAFTVAKAVDKSVDCVEINTDLIFRILEKAQNMR